MGYERILTGCIRMILISCSLCDVMTVYLPDKFEYFDELRNYQFLKQQFPTLNCEEMWTAAQE